MTTTRKTTTAPINWKQSQTLVKALVSDGNYNTALMFAAGFYFGLRISDILHLTWNDLLSDQFTIQERKTKKFRKINVHDEFKAIVSNVLNHLQVSDKDSLVFTHQRSDGNTSKPISVIAANKRIKKAFLQYGIIAQNPSSHTLRKTFGKRIYENNGQSEHALVTLSQIFNHRDISTTRKYIGLTEQVIQDAYLSL